MARRVVAEVSTDSGESRDTHNLMVTETHPTLPRTVLTSATTRLFTHSLDWWYFDLPEFRAINEGARASPIKTAEDQMALQDPMNGQTRGSRGQYRFG